MFNFMLNFRFSAELQGDRNKLLQVAQQFELEGLIAKNRIQFTKAADAAALG
jgi:hypothetical protein